MALPFLLSLGLPALGAATGGLGLGLGAASLAGIGAGLGSFLQTGDVGKGIQTGLIAGLGGKLMSSATNALGGAGAQASTQALTAEGLPAATGSNLINATLGKDLLTKKLGETTVAGALGAAGSGFGAGVIADAMNPPTFKISEKEKVDIPPPMPRIRSYQPKKNPYSTAEEEMITYYNPVQRKNLGGLMSMSSSHPIFKSFGENMAGFLTNQQIESNREKVQPFVQEVETLAKTTFGDDAFQQRAYQNTRPAVQMPRSRIPGIMPPSLSSKGGIGGSSPAVMQKGVGSFAKAFGGFGTMGFAEGGEVETPEDMNEKDVIVEAVKAIKGLSDAPEVALGIFLSEYGEEALRDLVEKVQSGALDDTIERFANGDKGMVEGMGDGSGEDDMIPATMDGEQGVLLTEGEFVMRQPTTKAIQDEFGSEFLDIINQSEDKAPEKIREMVGVES